jgi:hypothetical protein
MSVYAGSQAGPERITGAQRSRAAVIAAALAVALAAAAALVTLVVAGARSPGTAISFARSAGMSELGALPLAERSQLSSTAGARNASFAVHLAGAEAGRLTAVGRGIESSFGASGMTIRAHRTNVRLGQAELEGRPVLAGATPRAFRNRVTYQGRSLTEWYANGPLGVEQGFTVARAPAGAGDMRISFQVRASERPVMRDGRVSLGGGLLYGGLWATAADGRALPAQLQLHGDRVVLVIDAAHARFPVRVDPLVYQETLSGTEGQGSGIAVSGDGSTALVGGVGEEPGAVDVFVRSGTVWTLQQKLSPGGADDHGFGSRGALDGEGVALSGDGNTAMIVGYSSEGAAHIWTYTRSNGVWTADPKTLDREVAGVPTVGRDTYGDSIALSYNGATAAIGEPGDGYVFVMQRNGSGWKTAATLKDRYVEPEVDAWGDGLALSGNGKQLLIGSPGGSDGEGAKAIYFYGEQAGSWTFEDDYPYPYYDGEGPAALALDGEGDTALVGEYLGESSGDIHNGAAHVYVRSGASWSPQQTLTRTGAYSEAEEFGIEVGLSENGNVATVQGYGGNLEEGVGMLVWEYTRSGSTWTQQGPPLNPVGSFAGKIALSGDGHTLLLTTEPGVPPLVYVNDATVGPAEASEVTTKTALLSASVNPAGETVTACKFEYGTTTGYGSTAACSPKPAAQTTPVAVSASLKGLTSSVTYHFRVAVTTASGTAYDSDATFTTFASAATGSTSEPAKPATAKDGALTAVASGGTGEVTVASYGSNPGPAPLPGSTGGYADIYRSGGASFTEVEFKDCEVGDARALWFYGTEGWKPARPAATFSEGCGYFKATATSQPSVSELVGLKSKWGEPPGEYGQCHSGEAAVHLYAEKNCLTFHGKGGKADGKGKFEWFPVPIGCYYMKKGRYSDSTCQTADEAKGKGKGTYEAGSTSFTGTASSPKLAISGSSTIECSAGEIVGELTGPEKGTETVTLSGCSQAGAQCTSPNASAGTIATSPLEAISTEEHEQLMLTLTAVQLAQFTCASNAYTLTGAVSGPQGGVVNAMSKKGSAEFTSGEGNQLLVAHTGTTEHAATLTMTQTDSSSQALELDSAIKADG